MHIGDIIRAINGSFTTKCDGSFTECCFGYKKKSTRFGLDTKGLKKYKEKKYSGILNMKSAF